MSRWAAHTWLLLLIVVIAGILLRYHTHFPTSLLDDTEVDYLGRDTVLMLHLLSEGQERSKTTRYTARVSDGSKILLYLLRDSLPMPRQGDQLLVETQVRPGERWGDFDYGHYLRMQGIAGSAFAFRRNWQVVGHTPIKGLKTQAENCQRWLHERYRQMGIDGQELGIVSALTLGYREELDKSVQQSFSASGAMHILAVSGLHTGIVWSIIIALVTMGGLFRPLYEQHLRQVMLTMVALTALWTYAFITGMSPSVMRSALMVSVAEVAWLIKRHSYGMHNLCAAAVLILLIEPLTLWSVSFQLSFAAVAALILIAQPMQHKILVWGKLQQYIVGLLVMSLAAQIGTMPLSLYYFGQTSNYFALTNLVVIPAAYVLLLLGIGTLAMSWCVVGEWLGQLTEWCAKGLRLFVEWIEALPYSTCHIELSGWSVACCYGAIACAVAMMHGKNVRWWWLIGVVVCTLGCLLFNV